MAAFGCLLVQSEEGEVKDALAQLNQTEEIESRAISSSPMYHLSQVKTEKRGRRRRLISLFVRFFSML